MRDINDPVWSVIILLCCGLAFTLYCVIYILRLSYKELEEDVQVREQGQEGHCKQQKQNQGNATAKKAKNGGKKK